MTVREANWLKDAYNLVKNYNTNKAKRDLVHSTLTHNNKPVFFYIDALVRFSLRSGRDNYLRYYRQAFQRNNTYLTSRTARAIWKDTLPNRIAGFFRNCEADTGEFNRVLQASHSTTVTSPSLYSEEEHRKIAQLENQSQRGDVFIETLKKLAEKKEEPSSLFDRIKKYQKELQKLDLPEALYEETIGGKLPLSAREKLIKDGHFTKEEIEKIESLGLAKIESLGLAKKENFKSNWEWQKKVEDAQINLKEESLGIKRQAPVSPPLPPSPIPLATAPQVIQTIAPQPLAPHIPTRRIPPLTLPRVAPPKVGGVAKLLFKTPVGWGILGFLLLFFLLPILFSMNQSNSLTSSILGVGYAAPISGSSCPTQVTIDANKNASTCHYLGVGVNLFDINLSQSEIDKYINHYTIGDSAEFRNRVNYIVTNAKTAGLNPTIFLGYWKTESNFSTTGSRDMGCASAAIGFYEQVDCALGIKAFSDPVKNPIPNCAKSHDANSSACQALKSIRSKGQDSVNPISYPIATFDDFAEAYGAKTDDPNNCTHTYNILVEVAEELNACQATAPPPTQGLASSCPLRGQRTISCGSFMSDAKYNQNACSGAQPINRGHCGSHYGDCYVVGDVNATLAKRRAHSLDVNGSIGETVYLPTINGQSVNWTFSSGKSYFVVVSEGGGYGNVFETNIGSDHWVLHLVHTDQTKIPPPSGRGYQSGDPVTTIANTPFPHVHINIGKNPTSDNGGSGWLNPEDLGMCAQ